MALAGVELETLVSEPDALTTRPGILSLRLHVQASLRPNSSPRFKIFSYFQRLRSPKAANAKSRYQFST